MELRYNDSLVRDLGDYKIGGVAATFYNPANEGTEYNIYDNVYERIAPNAYDDCLNQEVLCRFDHKENIGVTPTSLKIWVDDVGLNYECVLDKDDSRHREIYRNIQNRLVRGSSFEAKGYRLLWSREGNKDIRTVTKVIKLVDVSPVYNAAYKGSTAMIRSAELDVIRREHEAWKKQLAAELRAEKAKSLLEQFQKM